MESTSGLSQIKVSKQGRKKWQLLRTTNRIGLCSRGIQQAINREGFKNRHPAYHQRVLDQAPFQEEVGYLNPELRITNNNFTSVSPAHRDRVTDSHGSQLWTGSRLERDISEKFKLRL